MLSIRLVVELEVLAWKGAQYPGPIDAHHLHTVGALVE